MNKLNAQKKGHIKLLQNKFGFKGSYAQLKELETYAHNLALDECNIPMETKEVKRREDHVMQRLDDLFDMTKLEGKFLFNKDARGYALKIESEHTPEDMITDWGRYGLLCPWQEL